MVVSLSTAALRDLEAAAEYAIEENFPVPSKIAVDNAERLIRAIQDMSRLRIEVYPTPDAEIALDVPNGRGQSVTLLCESGGGALCLANLASGHRSKRYPNADALPDKFLREVFMELGRGLT